MIEYIIGASACAGVACYLMGHASGEWKQRRAVKHAIDDALEWKRKFLVAAVERDAAQFRIRTAKALATPHMAHIGHRMVRALDGKLVLVSDRTRQLREEMKVSANG
jgi:hypothetical protein